MLVGPRPVQDEPVPSRLAPAVAALVVAAGALLAAAAVVVAAVRLPTDGAVLPVQRSSFLAEGVRVDAVDGHGLHDGDVVRAVDGARAGAELRGTGPVAGERLTYQVVRGGEVRDAAVRIEDRDVAGAVGRDWGGAVLVPALAIIGALLVWRRPDLPATRALLVLGTTSTLAWTLLAVGPSPLDLWTGRWWFLAAGPAVLVAECAVLHFVLVFPAPPAVLARRPWLVGLSYAVPLALHAVDAAISSVGATATEVLGAWSMPRLEPLLVVATVAVPLARLRRTHDPLARRQLRLVGWQLAGSGAVYVLVFGLPGALGGDPILPASFASVSFWPFPVVLAVAVLRFDLFEIRAVAHRSLLYAALTAAVIGLYAAVVGVLSAVTGEHAGFAASAVAAGAVAVAVQPLRRHLHDLVGRLVYGAAAEPYAVLAELGRRLEDQAHPAAVLDAAVETVARSLSRPSAAIEVDGEVMARFGSADGEVLSVPLVHQRAVVGTLSVGLRHEGEQLGPAEERLLADLAAHVGAALASTRLALAVQRSRERLVTALEDERRRVGRDLHDGLGPRLAAAAMKLEAADRMARRDLDAGLAVQEEVRAELQQVIAEVRRLVHGLRPTALDQLGLVGALEEQANRLAVRSVPAGGPDVALVVDGEIPELPAAVEVAAYRVASEAMTNAVRHSAASQVIVRLEVADQVVVEVVDDGRGMLDGVSPGIGLTSMHERAAELGGTVTIDRAPGGGTRVLARLPLEVS
jgi:signal transduction histidine kinase